ncbi:MAG: ATPase P [Deltaproteobacteria bacterium]|nr:ATPase P [Deltaproteobacteria bacterium]
MMKLTIPGYGLMELDHVVMDYNGTLAIDGNLINGVGDALTQLASSLSLHVLTADTFGKAATGLAGLPCKLSILPKEDQAGGKLAYVNNLGAERCACIGNGRNDRLMLKAAGLGMAVILEEGAALETVISADIVCTSITSALALLSNPLRLTATLRS